MKYLHSSRGARVSGVRDSTFQCLHALYPQSSIMQLKALEILWLVLA